MASVRALVAVSLLATFLLIATASPARASCAPPIPLTEAVQDSDLVVVGTVTATRSRGRIATVTVEDVWKGDPESAIEVAGGPEGDSMTTVDRTYTVGTRYLFFIFEPAIHGNPSTFGAVRGQRLSKHSPVHIRSRPAPSRLRPSDCRYSHARNAGAGRSSAIVG